MPLDFRKFRREIIQSGYTLAETSNGHFWVLTPTGGKLILFAVTHSKGKSGEVLESYVSAVRKAIRNDQLNQDQDHE